MFGLQAMGDTYLARKRRARENARRKHLLALLAEQRRKLEYLFENAEAIIGLEVEANTASDEWRRGVIRAVGRTPYLNEPEDTIRFYVCAVDRAHDWGHWLTSNQIKDVEV